jgi:hypothetical protein
MSQLAPTRYVLANRPVPLAQTYTDPGATAPVKAVRVLAFNSSWPQASSSILIPWDSGNKSETFTFVASPNNSGNELPLIGSLSVPDYAHAIWLGFLSNFELAQDFDITYNVISGSQFNIVLTCRTAGIYGNGTSVPSVSPSTFITASTTTNGVAAVYSDNTSAVLEVYVENGYLTGGFSRAYAGVKKIFGSETIVWDIAQVLRSFLSPTLPYWNQPTTLTTHLRRFYIRTALELGTPIRKERMTIYPDPGTDYKNYGHAILGGQDWQFWLPNAAEFGDYQFFSRYPNFPSMNKFKRVLKITPEFLTWFNYTSPIEPALPVISDIKVYSIVTFDTGLSSSPYLHFTYATNPGDLITIPVGFNQLGLWSVYPGQVIRSYEIQIWDDTDSLLLAEQRFYSVYNSDLSISSLKRNIDRVIHLVFLNNVGGWCTLICSDNYEHNFTVDQELTQKFVQPFYNPHESTEVVSDVNFREVIKFRSLPLQEHELSWAMELLQSKFVYFVDVTGPGTDVWKWREIGLTGDQVLTVGPTNKFVFIAVNLRRGSFRISTSTDNLRVIELEIALPPGRVRYSKELP